MADVEEHRRRQHTPDRFHFPPHRIPILLFAPRRLCVKPSRPFASSCVPPSENAGQARPLHAFWRSPPSPLRASRLCVKPSRPFASSCVPPSENAGQARPLHAFWRSPRSPLCVFAPLRETLSALRLFVRPLPKTPGKPGRYTLSGDPLLLPFASSRLCVKHPQRGNHDRVFLRQSLGKTHGGARGLDPPCDSPGGRGDAKSPPSRRGRSRPIRPGRGADRSPRSRIRTTPNPGNSPGPASAGTPGCR